jgi:meso-butanediol dehydrogenase / (S,S)-butanediol dehydrogenase / diacetyl reductase
VRQAGAPDALGMACDVSSEVQVAATVKAAMDRFARLDVVVNNAGLMTFKSLEELTPEDWQRVLNVDLFGAVHFTKQAFLTMKPGGAIVNVASIHAVMTEPLVAPYAAGKAAVVSLTRSASIEGKAKGIRVNVVLAGAIDTPMLWDNPNVKSGAEKIDPSVVGKPEDIAAAIAFLASDDAAFVTGTALRVVGGRLDRLSARLWPFMRRGRARKPKVPAGRDGVLSPGFCGATLPKPSRARGRAGPQRARR